MSYAHVSISSQDRRICKDKIGKMEDILIAIVSF